MNDKKSTLFHYALLGGMVTLYIFFQCNLLHNDLWNDEVYTLQHFVFVPLHVTLFDYHVPNNHQFANIINHFFLKLTGTKDTFELMEKPGVLRGLYLAYSLCLLFFLYRTGKKFFSPTIGLLSVCILVTSIPYYNFALQIRGYELSALFLVLLVYLLFSYQDTGKKQYLFLIAGVVFLFLYTIPLGFYVIIPLLLFLSIEFTLSFISNRADGKFKVPMSIIFSILIGITAFLLIEMPIWKEIFFNENVRGSEDSRLHYLREDVPAVFVSFLSYRYLLAALFIAGLCFIRRQSGVVVYRFVLLAIILVGPFLISIIRKDGAPDRAFVNLMPVFALLSATGIGFLLQRFWLKPGYSYLFALGLFAYCSIIFYKDLKLIDAHMLDDIKTAKRSQSLFYNYYLAHYHPMQVAFDFKSNYYTDSTLVVVRDCEPHDFFDYLQKVNVKYVDSYYDIDKFFERSNDFYIVTRFPDEVMGIVATKHPGFKSTTVSREYSYHNFIHVYRQ